MSQSQSQKTWSDSSAGSVPYSSFSPQVLSASAFKYRSISIATGKRLPRSYSSPDSGFHPRFYTQGDRGDLMPARAIPDTSVTGARWP